MSQKKPQPRAAAAAFEYEPYYMPQPRPARPRPARPEQTALDVMFAYYDVG
ncbi:hypothetical protein [Aliigemmobacter aestuarii]|uniref:hypothetical protein n=1 Tax=Aliigemmobacter aestuarii TaxID=1445661 RepID=UPI001454BD4A|nr:hypothetical protein [Gemmobacter aestuarii]